MIIESDFRPAPWLPGPHLQTLWPALFRRAPRPPFERERLELPDGDFLDLDRLGPSEPPGVVLILHGLEGSSGSHYARGLASALSDIGLQAVIMHFRGCSGEPNRLARAYHSGETGDFDWVLRTLIHRYPDIPFMAVGYSLGGNVLLKWLGEQGADAPLRAVCAVSVPFVLSAAAQRLSGGFSRLYQWALLRRLRRSLGPKIRSLPEPPVQCDLGRLRSFRAFDEHVTAPLHGFDGADDYYRQASSLPYLKAIRVPTLILQARDDPFYDPAFLPRPEELADCVTLELSTHGGHVGFVSGGWPWQPEFWLDRRVLQYVSAVLAPEKRKGP